MAMDTTQEWVLLIHQLPSTPTNLRVRTWRKLQRLGAVVLKNSVYVLPFNEKTYEDFQWLKQEIESAGGEATLLRAGVVEGTADKEIISVFCHARDEEYSKLAAELEGLVGSIREQKRGGHLTDARVSSYEAELDKLHNELERLIAIDFFNASGRSTATAAFHSCQKALRASQNRNQRLAESVRGEGATLTLKKYQGRRWFTRRNLFIDRLASIWLIKRFIDRHPRFYFVSEEETVTGGIGFDMVGAEFTHAGEDCTFETLIKQFGLNQDVGLRAIAEIVHDIDLKDNKFNRLEAAGFSATIRGVANMLKNDNKLMRQGILLFDGLYALLRQQDGVDAEPKGRKKRGPQVRQPKKRSGP
jgi:hypothetical protein